MDRGQKRSVLWFLVLVNAAYSRGWGTYFCDVKDGEMERIRETCTSAISEVKVPFGEVEEKLDRVLQFVQDMKKAENSWFHLSKKSGTVERDLSQHEETRGRDGPRDRTDREDREDRDGSGSGRSGDGERDRTYGEESRDRDGYLWQDTRYRSSRYGRENRRDRSGEDFPQRTDREDSVTHGADNSTAKVSPPEDSRRPQKTDENEPGKGGCSSIVIDDHETIGMFYMNSFQHGHCSNRNPISQPIRFCLGYCATKTFIERENGVWSQGSDCKSCQPMNYETIRIPLTCDDGFEFEKKFQNIIDCKCMRCSSAEDV